MSEFATEVKASEEDLVEKAGNSEAEFLSEMTGLASFLKVEGGSTGAGLTPLLIFSCTSQI